MKNAEPIRDLKFICDVHLGRLSKYLRMLGFDTVYSNQLSPEEIINRLRASTPEVRKIMQELDGRIGKHSYRDQWVRDIRAVERRLLALHEKHPVKSAEAPNPK